MKVIVIGLDGVGFELINKHLDAWPVFNYLYKHSQYGVLKSPEIPVTVPSFTCFQTGKSLFNHGLTNFMSYDKDFNMVINDSTSIKDQTFYEILDVMGKRVFMMNMVYTFPPKIHGDIVASWVSHQNSLEDLVYPTSLLNKYPSLKNYQVFPKPKITIKGKINEQINQLRKNNKCFLEVFTRSNYDFYFYLVSNTDWVQHLAYNELINEEGIYIVEKCKELFSEVNKLLENIINSIDKNTMLIIMSDHGFKIYDGKFFINTWLLQNDYLKKSVGGKLIDNWIDKGKGININVSRITNWAKSHPFLLKPGEYMYRSVSELPFLNLHSKEKVDLHNSIAYCPSFVDGIIYVKKPEYIPEIIEKMNEHVSCKNIHNSILPGDILVSSDKYELDTSLSNNIILLTPRNYHNRDGIMFFYGKHKGKIIQRNMHDLMPTILRLLGCPSPQNIDGQIITEVI